MSRKHLLRRRAGAFSAGVLAIFVLSAAADAVMHGSGVFPKAGDTMPDAFWLLAAGYRAAFGVGCSYLTARLAPDKPLAHALAFGVFGLVLSSVATVATWHAGPAFGPHWYPLLVAASALPCAYVGGWLRLGRSVKAQRVQAVAVA